MKKFLLLALALLLPLQTGARPSIANQGFFKRAGIAADAVQATCPGTLIPSGAYDICVLDTVGSGSFVVSAAGASATIDVEVIAGAASGGGGQSGGGGASGGFCRHLARSITAGSYSYTVGAPGAGTLTIGNNGSDSIYDTITAVGGGKGGYPDGSPSAVGSPGGSGGGGGDDSVARAGGSSTQPGTSGGATCFGFAGGSAYGAPPYNGGGGGSATEAGESAGILGGGKGGDGILSSIMATLYAAGGGAGAGSSGANHGVGGLGGGGNAGSPLRGCEGQPGTSYGSGGGGAGRSCTGSFLGGDGFKGAILLKYKRAA